MCSIVRIDHNAGSNESVCYNIIISKFWSNREYWSPGCFIAANIKISEYSCQLQVFPTENGQTVNIIGEGSSNDGEVTLVNKSEQKENQQDGMITRSAKKRKSKSQGEDCQVIKGRNATPTMLILLVNTSESDLIINGVCCMGQEMIVENVELPKSGKLRLYDLKSEEIEYLEKCKSDDLEIVLKLDAKPGLFPGCGDNVKKEAEKKPFTVRDYVYFSLHETEKNFSNLKSMIGELRNRIMGEMESIQNILRETPLSKVSKEISNLRKDVHQLQRELTDIMNTKSNVREETFKDSYAKIISKEVSDVFNRELSAVLESNATAQAKVEFIMKETRNELLQSVDTLDTSIGAQSKLLLAEPKTLTAISEVKLQLEMLQDSVLSVVSSPARGLKPANPECPYCMEDFLPSSQILQCKSGHLICLSCRSKHTKCPSCHEEYTGRNRGLEAYLLKLRDG